MFLLFMIVNRLKWFKVFSVISVFGSALVYLLLCETNKLISLLKGPPGKDGLPGHPGQRGEVVR